MADPLYNQQEQMAAFYAANDLVLNTSDPGTGKTRGTLEGYMRRRIHNRSGRVLVVAPLSILEPSWGDDIESYTPLTFAIAHGSPAKRKQAFESDAEIVLINFDGVKWIDGLSKTAQSKLLLGFTDLIIDEFTAFKNRSAQRSKAMLKVSKYFSNKVLLSGTPNPNTITDLWHPMMIMDGGARLGSRYFKFREQVCKPVSTGYGDFVTWEDIEGAEEAVADALSDISIRFKFEDCVDIPPQVMRFPKIKMPKKVMDAYREMEQHSILQFQQNTNALVPGTFTAVHAAAKIKKMLQILSGSMYGENGTVLPINNGRYDLIAQMVDERDHSLVAFNWQHEKEGLVLACKKLGHSIAVIDGTVPKEKRTEIVRDFQDGKYKVLFCHPAATSHGLTLTKARTIIWSSPTYSSEQFIQFNRRIYRIGQTQSTEVICISARGTKEEDVYKALQQKVTRTEDLLNILLAQSV